MSRATQLEDTWQTVLAVVDERGFAEPDPITRERHRINRRVHMAKLAAIVERRPGELEQLLHQHFAELAQLRPGERFRSKLSHLFVRGSGGGQAPRFMTQAQPRPMLELCLRTLRHPDFLGTGAHVTGRLAAVSKLARIWLDAAAPEDLQSWELPPAVLDAHRAARGLAPLPALLPGTAELAAMSASEVEARICAYLGLELERVTARMAPDVLSDVGFLEPGQRLGDQIVRDARILARLGVDHRDVAQRIELCVALGHIHERRRLLEGPELSPAELEASARAEAAAAGQHVDERELAAIVQTMLAHQEAERARPRTPAELQERAALEAELRVSEARIAAPLVAALGPSTQPDGSWTLPWAIETVQSRSVDADPLQTLWLVSARGSIDFVIEDEAGDNLIEGEDLSIDLIRRACFFGGRGTPDRIDPELAARVLGLVGADPLGSRLCSSSC